MFFSFIARARHCVGWGGGGGESRPRKTSWSVTNDSCPLDINCLFNSRIWQNMQISNGDDGGLALQQRLCGLCDAGSSELAE